MKKYYFASLLLALLFQFSFLSRLSFLGNVPNLILIVTVIIGIRKSLPENFAWFFLAGFLLEIFSHNTFGLSLIIFLLTGSSAWFLRNIVLSKEKNIFLKIVFWFLVKIIFDLIYWIIFYLNAVFTKSGESIKIFDSWGNYFKEILIFVFFGILLTFLSRLTRNLKHNEKKTF